MIMQFHELKDGQKFTAAGSDLYSDPAKAAQTFTLKKHCHETCSVIEPKQYAGERVALPASFPVTPL